MAAVSLSWDQINTWRLAETSLLEPAEPAQMLDVVQRIGGLHAQLMSAAELSLSARVKNLPATAVQDALWNERTLVKSWFLRGTLHLLTVQDYPYFIAVLSTLKHYLRNSWLKFHGLEVEDLEALMNGADAVLSDQPMTREALANTYAERTGKDKLRELLRSGWGALLKPISFHGNLCYGPSEGQNVTFVSPGAWLGAWEPVETDTAMKALVRRFLMAYGPATSAEFARWIGLEPSAGKKAFTLMGKEIRAVEIDGWKAKTFALATMVEKIRTFSKKDAPSIRLLPHFDPYTVTLSPQSDYLFPDVRLKKKIYRPQGWIYPAVLIDGRFGGWWEADKKGGKTFLDIEMFDVPSAPIQRGIAAEAKRISDFLQSEVEIRFQ